MSQEVLEENKMGYMPEGKLLLNMSLPMMASMLVQALYNIVDSIFVSYISQDALTAVSLAFSLQTIMIAVGAGTGVGVNALVSRALGEKNKERASNVAMNGIFIFFLSYIAIAILGMVAVKPFYAFQTDASQKNIMDLGVEYLSIAMIFSFGVFAQFIFERLLQATGRTFYTMISQTVGAIINIIFDPIFIFGLCGCPKMGISGAAIATVFGQCVSAIIAFIFNIKKNTDIDFKFKGFRPDRHIIANIYEIAIPSIIMQSIGSFMTAGMNKILMGLNDTAASVFGVYFKLQSFFFMPVFGLNNGLIPILSYNYGAKKRSRMINTMKYAYIIAFFLTAIGFVSFTFFPKQLLLLFNASDEMLSIGIPALHIIAIHYLIAWFCIVTGSLFQAIGKAMYSLYVSVCRQLVILLPAAYILAKIGGLSIIWWCFPIAEMMSLIISTICLIHTRKYI